VLYESCGHAPFHEAPERFNRSLIQFLKDTRT
jgi:pimeloyl-ACP methyl ester carboxylesterase